MEKTLILLPIRETKAMAKEPTNREVRNITDVVPDDNEMPLSLEGNEASAEERDDDGWGGVTALEDEEAGDAPSEPDDDNWDEGYERAYQEVIYEIDGRLGQLEADIGITGPEAKEAATWLNDNELAIDYFFGRGPLRSDHSGGFRVPSEREIRRSTMMDAAYPLPVARQEAYADRSSLYFGLLSAFWDYSKERSWLSKSVRERIFHHFVRQLQNQFEATANPTYAWHAANAVLICNASLPRWLKEYLLACADRVVEAGEVDDKLSFSEVSRIFAFANEECQPIGQLSCVSKDIAKVNAYKILKNRNKIQNDKENMRKNLLKIAGKKIGKSEKSAARYYDQIKGSLKTKDPLANT
jgi:hypothetical protein